MTPRISSDPQGLPALLSHADAIAFGLTRSQISRRVSRGLWESLGDGHYIRGGARLHTDPAATNDLQHVYEAVAASRSRPATAISHTSAALAHRLPVVSGPPRRIHLLAGAGGWTGTRGKVRSHLGTLHDGDSSHIDVHAAWIAEGTGAAPAGALTPVFARVTTPSRTIIDVARFGTLADTLGIGDAALRREMTSLTELTERHIRISDHPGSKRAALALAHLSGIRETPLESLSFARFIEWGVPLPQCQVSLHDHDGFVARVDFLWEEFGIVGEADGAAKYIDREILLQQGQREVRLRDLGFRILRWTWVDLITGALHRRMLQLLEIRNAA